MSDRSKRIPRRCNATLKKFFAPHFAMLDIFLRIRRMRPPRTNRDAVSQGKQEAFLFFWFSENQILKEDDGIGSVKATNSREA